MSTFDDDRARQPIGEATEMFGADEWQAWFFAWLVR